MSLRFEWIDAARAEVDLVHPGEQVDGSDDDHEETRVEDHPLVLGDASATALVVFGPTDELRAFARRVADQVPIDPTEPDVPAPAVADGLPAEHDDGPDGECAGADITLTYLAAVYVAVGEGAVKRVKVDDGSAELDPLAGGECSGCCRALPADHPAVVAAAAVAEDGDTEWTAWVVDQ